MLSINISNQMDLGL